MITLCPGSLILGNVMKLPDLSESLKIPGSQLKLSSDPIGQGERYYVRIFYCTCTVRVFLILHDSAPFKNCCKPCFQGKLEWCTYKGLLMNWKDEPLQAVAVKTLKGNLHNQLHVI